MHTKSETMKPYKMNYRIIHFKYISWRSESQFFNLFFHFLLTDQIGIYGMGGGCSNKKYEKNTKQTSEMKEIFKFAMFFTEH